MKKISTLVGIIIIVVIAAIAFGGVFVYQYFSAKTNNIQTAGWKTYTNTQYGFEIKYPVGTQISNINENDPLSNTPALINILFKPTDSKGVLMINVRNKDNGCYDTALGADPEHPTINGISFIKWDFSKYLSTGIDTWGNGQEYCVVHDKLTYGLVAEIKYPANSQVPGIEPVFDQMISTFTWICHDGATNYPHCNADNPKFLATTTQDQTAGWKTYTNTQYGFEFQYDPLVNKVTLEGNRVHVLFENPTGSGQWSGDDWIETFAKDPAVSFSDAIRQVILKNYPSKYCQISTNDSGTPDLTAKGWVTGSISDTDPRNTKYPAPIIDNCNLSYVATNYPRFFFYNPSHPNVFFFYNTAQSPFHFFDTLKFTK